MKKICESCQYYRAGGAMDDGIPGAGTWCSNSQSPKFRVRVLYRDSCDMFQARGQKAGLGLRLQTKGLGLVNKVLRKKK